MRDSIEARLTELRDIARKYALAEGERTYLEKFEKSKLAILQKKYMGEQTSVAAQEREARADPEYIELLQGLRVATESATRLKWELEIARMGAGLWQTEQANLRVERKAYGS
jgi:hypothetical protein